MKRYPVPAPLTRMAFAALLCVAFLPAAFQAKTNCGPTAYGPPPGPYLPPVPTGRQCISEVDFARFVQTAADTQKESQWCWAASISMIFSFHGHRVVQPRIVTEAYGGIVNMPAISGITIAKQVNRDWVDENGRRFRSTLTSAYDGQAGLIATNNLILINELDRERPFIVGTKGHAVVGTMMRYWQFPDGSIGQVFEIGVFDPWPASRRARSLSPIEMVPLASGGALSFIATVTVD